ncbi:MAG: hypothetical protein M3N02_07910, partial [Pseudomonadota bacterium]|nr:hypothetical protein [Pseudomonadota bacterium]
MSRSVSVAVADRFETTDVEDNQRRVDPSAGILRERHTGALGENATGRRAGEKILVSLCPNLACLSFGQVGTRTNSS